MDHHRLEALLSSPLGRRRGLLLGIRSYHPSNDIQLGRANDMSLLLGSRRSYVRSRRASVPILLLST